MDAFYNPNSDSTLTPNNRISALAELGDISPRTVIQPPPQYNDQRSDTSSNSEASFRDRNMYRGDHRGGRGGSRGGGQNSRAYSNSSGSSNSQHNRPTLKQASIPPTHQTHQPLQAPRSVGPSTMPAQQQSYVDANGHSIHETYTERSSTSSDSPTKRAPVMGASRLLQQASPPHGTSHHRYSSGGQHNSPKPTLKDGTQYWAYNQEHKIRILDIPKGYWTKEVYESMSPFGTVFRIDMESGPRNNAYVVFR